MSNLENKCQNKNKCTTSNTKKYYLNSHWHVELLKYYLNSHWHAELLKYSIILFSYERCFSCFLGSLHVFIHCNSQHTGKYIWKQISTNIICGFNYTERVSIRQRIKQSVISVFFQNIVRTEIMMKDSWKPSEYFHLQ